MLQILLERLRNFLELCYQLVLIRNWVERALDSNTFPFFSQARLHRSGTQSKVCMQQVVH